MNCPVYRQAWGCSDEYRPNWPDTINNLCPKTCGLCGRGCRRNSECPGQAPNCDTTDGTCYACRWDWDCRDPLKQICKHGMCFKGLAYINLFTEILEVKVLTFNIKTIFLPLCLWQVPTLTSIISAISKFLCLSFFFKFFKTTLTFAIRMSRSRQIAKTNARTTCIRIIW